MITDNEFKDHLVKLLTESNNKVEQTNNDPSIGIREFDESSDSHDDHVDALGYMLPTHPEYLADEHIVNAIDQILINTLTNTEYISESTARTLEILNSIKLDTLNFNVNLELPNAE